MIIMNRYIKNSILCFIVFHKLAFSEDLINVNQLENSLNNAGSVQIIESEASFKVLLDFAALINNSEIPLDRDLKWFAPGCYDFELYKSWANKYSEGTNIIKRASSKRGFGLPYGKSKIDLWRKLNFQAEIISSGSLGTKKFGYQNAIDLLNRYAVLTSWEFFKDKKGDKGLNLIFSMIKINRSIAEREFLIEKKESLKAISGLCESARDMLYLYGSSVEASVLRKLAHDNRFIFENPRGIDLPYAEYLVAKNILKGIYDRSAMPNQLFSIELSKRTSSSNPIKRFGARRFWDLLSKEQLVESGDSQVLKMTSAYDEVARQWKEPKSSPMRKMRKAVWFIDSLNKVRFAPVHLLMKDIRQLFLERDISKTQLNGLISAMGLVAYKNKLGKYPDRIKKMYSMVLPKTADVDWMRDDLKGFRYALVGKEGDGDPDIRGGRIRLILSGGIVYDGQELTLPKRGNPLLFSVGTDQLDGNMTLHSIEDVDGADVLLWPPVVGLIRDENILDQY